MGAVTNAVIGGVVGFFTGGPVGAIIGAVGGFAAGRAQERREEAAERAVAEQKRQNALNNAQQAIQRGRQIRQALAEQRVRAAIIESRGFAGGPAGAGQSVAGDTATAIGAANVQQAAAFGISQSQNRQADFALESRSSNTFDTIASVANLASTGLNLFNRGSFDAIGTFGRQQAGV